MNVEVIARAALQRHKNLYCLCFFPTCLFLLESGETLWIYSFELEETFFIIFCNFSNKSIGFTLGNLENYEHISVVVAYVITGICTHCSCNLHKLGSIGCLERTILLTFKLYPFVLDSPTTLLHYPHQIIQRAVSQREKYGSITLTSVLRTLGLCSIAYSTG
jgi:hypothetical protein